MSFHKVSHSTTSENVFRTTWSCLDFFTEATNSHINCTNITKIVISPNRLKEMLACHHLTNMLRQMIEQFKLTMRQLDFLSVLFSNKRLW